MSRRKRSREPLWDDVVMILLALASGALLVWEFSASPDVARSRIIDRIDLTIALVFLGEFLVKLFISPAKAAFLRGHWWYLLASIPISTPATQALRMIRLVRLVKLSRLLRLPIGVRELVTHLDLMRKQTYVAYVCTVWVVVVFSGSLAFFAFEHGENAAVRDLFDSVWWTFVTITTVGYGDIYPVTVGGRIVGMLLMGFGTGLMSIFTALTASFLITRTRGRR